MATVTAAVLTALLAVTLVQAGSDRHRATRRLQGLVDRPRRRRWRWPLRSPARPAVSTHDVATLAGELAALSRAGLPAAVAWRALAARSDATAVSAAVRVVDTALATGAGASQGLRIALDLAAGRHQPALAWLAAAVEVCERSGAPVAELLDRFAAALRHELDDERARRVALAGPRATAALLSALPALGLAAGGALGVDPLGTLLGSRAGLASLLGGGALWSAGRLWLRALIRRAERATTAGAPGPRGVGS